MWQGFPRSLNLMSNLSGPIKKIIDQFILIHTFISIFMNSKIDIRLSVPVGMIILAAFSRLIPHMPNFSPLGAICIFGAAHFAKKWHAFIVPLTATWLSDLYLNNVVYREYNPNFTWFYSGFYWQYGAYVLIVLWGILSLKKFTIPKVILGAFGSSAIFFLTSNFGVWVGSKYPQDFGGLIACYAAGIPFLKGTFLGDITYSAILFGSFAVLSARYPVLTIEKSRNPVQV